ncbi:uncharacterized protein ghi [Fopius arisanus]|uniref:Uncharacterized protein ghi n=1 Tax=Fopius arisanus TaxID=64838 RepID=A0A9R1UBB0_9HYME|nr:PREDICTED: uncharacterized protein LOC105273587 [Fopius arisanus]
MGGILNSIWSFFAYWYFRYTIVTELYMVAKWERYFMNIFFLAMFGLLFIFNYNILLPTTTSLFIRQ